MNLFHKKQPDYREQLTTLKAKLARAELLPNSAFTIAGNMPPFTMRHGIDEKPKRIAELKAEIAYLEVMSKETV